MHGCPKPPPTRVCLTLLAIQSAHEVWVVAAGGEKADAARLALSGAGPLQVPAAGAVGRAARCGCSTGRPPPPFRRG